MRFDPFKIIRALEVKHPDAAFWLTMRALNFMSPFNAHLKTRLITWTDKKIAIKLKRNRRVRNHVAAIHAGAQFTLGETCAGLLIIRNFPFGTFRPLMSDVSVVYMKQARGDITGECLLSEEEISRIKTAISQGDIPKVEMTTNISGDVNGRTEIICIVKTVWQIKSWSFVKSL